jgi:ATP-dependent protease ClpP protease subunit
VAKEKPPRVTVQLQTQGGRSLAALSIRGQLRLLYETQQDVQVVVSGYCHSAGLSILMAVPVERRFATHESSFMIHPCSAVDDNGRLVTELSQAQIVSMRDTNDRWIVNLIAENSAVEKSSLQELINAGQEAFLTAEEALELGLIGGIL